jgi:hypothetical protein
VLPDGVYLGEEEVGLHLSDGWSYADGSHLYYHTVPSPSLPHGERSRIFALLHRVARVQRTDVSVFPVVGDSCFYTVWRFYPI